MDKRKVFMDKRKVLLIVENLPVPFDRRVWAEAVALAEGGYQVSVICPNKANQAKHEVLQGVSIYRYRPPGERGGALGYLWEYTYSIIAALWLSFRVRRREGFDVIHIACPPDMLSIIGRVHAVFGRKKLIMDHHDLSPELVSLRYDPSKSSLMYKMILGFERRAFRAADVVISTNESYKAIAVKRGNKSPDSVFVVRNGPDIDRFKPVEPNPALKNGRAFLVCYVGVMGDQDGVDHLIRAAEHIIKQRGRSDILFKIIGSGDAVEDLKQLAQDLGMGDDVIFTGRISEGDLIDHLSTADVCAVPDPYNDFNDKCTFIKVAEYMAMGKPAVSFDLTESRYTADEAAVYAGRDNDPALFGDKIVELIDDPEKRRLMGEFGKRRVAESLAWQHSKAPLLAAYEKALGA